MVPEELEQELTALRAKLTEADELISELETQVATLEIEKSELQKALDEAKDSKKAMSGDGACWWCGKE